MSAAADHARAVGAPLRVHYRPAGASAGEDAGTLVRIGFGRAAHGDVDAARIDVALRPLGAPIEECWQVQGEVQRGRDGAIRWARNDALQFACLEVAVGDDIRRAGEHAYATLRHFLAASPQPHALRLWNYFDAITDGEGDAERYRQFCIGRAAGMGASWGPYPAATAIGRSRAAHTGTLQVYALSSTAPGVPLENPRQVAAWCYPRQYGPQSPSFARAMRDAGARLPLLLSGTASVVGHASAHVGCLERQVEETCANLDRLLAGARERDPALPPAFGAASVLKVYLRQPERAAAVAAQLEARYPGVHLLLLEADVCRRELLVEIDGFHG